MQDSPRPQSVSPRQGVGAQTPAVQDSPRPQSVSPRQGGVEATHVLRWQVWPTRQGGLAWLQPAGVVMHVPLEQISPRPQAALEVQLGGVGRTPPMPGVVRSPQSAQSVPIVQMEYSLPEPPSSQSRSLLARHVLEQPGIIGGGGPRVPPGVQSLQSVPRPQRE